MQDRVSPSAGEHSRSEEFHYTQKAGGGNNPGLSSSAEHAHTNTNTYLRGLSELAGRSFVSTQETLEAILQLIVDQLGLRSSFLTRISCEQCQSEVIVARNLAGGSDVQPGTLLELPGTY